MEPGSIAPLALLAALTACKAPYLDLEIADRDVPFLEAGKDFDGLGVEARAPGCADDDARYPALPLPATVTVLRGRCMNGAVDLRATAYLGGHPIARSAWIGGRFSGSGPVVVTATIAPLPDRALFATGYEAGQPYGDRTAGLPIVVTEGVSALDARVTEDMPIAGRRSARLSGVATASAARAIVRVAEPDLVIASGDRLELTLFLDPAAPARTVGVDVELETRVSARDLGLVESGGLPVDPASDEGRVPGLPLRWRIDLSRAAGVRLTGLLLGFDSRRTLQGGRFDVRLDEVSIVRE